MGIDFLELTIEVEERFGVTLAPEDGPELATVGGLVDAVRRRLRAGEQTGLTLRAWFQIRELLREVAGDPDFRVRPSERLVDRLTPARRRDLWRRLPAAFGGTPPPLGLGPMTGLAVVAVILLGNQVHTRPPAGYRTAGELARRLVGRTAAVPARGDPRRGDPGEEAVREVVRAILIEEVGIPAERVTPLRRGDRFVEDLGLN